VSGARLGPVTWRLSALAATIALAYLSYRFFEAPFLRLKERFAYVSSSGDTR
jgi:peptidoglycan/LPS O-acetylase OafA/YrhL